MKQITCLLFIFISLSISVFGQYNAQQQRERERARERSEEKKTQEKFQRLRIIRDGLSNNKTPKKAPTIYWSSSEDKKYIAPSKADKAKYKGLLKLKNTKIVKLLNHTTCFDNGEFKLVETCRPGINGFGMHYSFRSKRHLNKSFSDIMLYKNLFIATGSLNQGIITELGNVKFEDISLDSDGVKFLTDYKPAVTEEGTDEQTQKIENGIQDGNFSYKDSTEIKQDYVYAMRTIAYRAKINKASYDKRMDLILIFKVINTDENDNVTIIWRQLQSKESPKLDVVTF